VVEVLFGGWFIMRMKILIDGKKVAGNLVSHESPNRLRLLMRWRTGDRFILGH
jgi:hypothetical protein